MQTTRNIASTTAVLAALVLTMETPAEGQRRGERGDGSRRAGGELWHGGNFGGQLRGADLARARTGGSSALRRMSRSGDSSRYISSSDRSGSTTGDWSRAVRFASSRDPDSHTWHRRNSDKQDWSRHHSGNWDRSRHSRRDWDDRYRFNIGYGGGYPSYSSYYSYPYYSSSYPSYGYGYTSPYAYYGYPFPYSGYTHYTGYSSYYGTGGYYW